MSEKFAADLVGALDNSKVASKLLTIFKQAAKEISNNHDKKYTEILATVNSLRADIKARDVLIQQLRDDGTKMKLENDGLKLRVTELELETRRNNLVFTGLKPSYADATRAGEHASTTSANLIQQVTEFCSSDLGCATTPDDIGYIYALPSVANRKPMVVVNFVKRYQRDTVMSARRKLAGKPFYINEDLPNVTRKMMGQLRDMFRKKLILGCWTHLGKAFVKKLDGSTVSVKNISDIQ